VTIIVSNIKDEAQMTLAEETYADLQERGVEVLFDDRKERFGFKMKDFELIGTPLAVVIGKNLVEGNVELIEREGLKKQQIPAADILQKVMERV
jgi:prolyl-tRNA synthetase